MERDEFNYPIMIVTILCSLLLVVLAVTGINPKQPELATEGPTEAQNSQLQLQQLRLLLLLLLLKHPQQHPHRHRLKLLLRLQPKLQLKLLPRGQPKLPQQLQQSRQQLLNQPQLPQVALSPQHLKKFLQSTLRLLIRQKRKALLIKRLNIRLFPRIRLILRAEYSVKCFL